MDPNDSAFKHGTLTGYTAGCRKTYPCPATPTCNEEANRHQRELRKRREANDPKKGRYTTYVLRRLNQTLEHVTPGEVGEFLHMRGERINAIAERRDKATRGVRIHEKLAAELDRAWAWFVHGRALGPDVKHGTASGYFVSHCRCTVCGDYAARHRRRFDAGIKDPAQEIVTIEAGFAAHVRSLIAAAGSVHALSRVTGLAAHRLTNMGAPGTTVRAATVQILASHTPATVATAVEAFNGKVRVDATRTHWLMGTLAALGYPKQWQKAAAGIPHARTETNATHVLRSTERAMEALHERLRETPATEADGITRGSISRAKNFAASQGYYPPCSYDDDGTLNVRAIPGHAFGELDIYSEHKIHLLYLLTQGDNQLEAARKVGCSPDVFRNLRHGLKYTNLGGQGGTYLDHLASRDRIVEIRETYDRMVRGEIGAVTATILLDVHNKDLIRRVNSPEGLHPEIVAWRERTTPTTADAA